MRIGYRFIMDDDDVVDDDSKTFGRYVTEIGFGRLNGFDLGACGP